MSNRPGMGSSGNAGGGEVNAGAGLVLIIGIGGFVVVMLWLGDAFGNSPF